MSNNQSLTQSDFIELINHIKSHEDYSTFIEHLKLANLTEPEFESTKLLALNHLRELNKQNTKL